MLLCKMGGKIMCWTINCALLIYVEIWTAGAMSIRGATIVKGHREFSFEDSRDRELRTPKIPGGNFEEQW